VTGEGDALLLIDLQEAFFEEPVMAAARDEVITGVSRLAEAARRREVPVFLISTEHSRDRSTWTLSMLDDDQGYLFHGDAGTATVAELETVGMTRVEKTRDSAWLGTDLPLRLRNLQVESVVIAGVSAHACIAATARDAYAHNLRATIVTDAVADEREEHMDMVLDLLVGDRQASLAQVADVLEGWGCDGSG
jgi:nicotinamidase-related amidase